MGKSNWRRRTTQKIKEFKDASHVSAIGQFIVSELRKLGYLVEVTFGSITKSNRMASNLIKAHDADTLVIAGENVSTARIDLPFFAKFVRRQNRFLHKANLLKGGREKVSTIRSTKGYKRFDKVLYDGVECFIYGLRTSGCFDLRKLDGRKIHASANWKKLKKLESAKTLLIERQVNVTISLQLTEVGVSLPQKR
ncbi:MAG: hypothetical protein M1542_07080 [Thermotogae bacterium]|nr:hypothetical protein [Thermotogota bacterium]MCL5032987.1 hypothetical protein [Thermotogota bacterium]